MRPGDALGSLASMLGVGVGRGEHHGPAAGISGISGIPTCPYTINVRSFCRYLNAWIRATRTLNRCFSKLGGLLMLAEKIRNILSFLKVKYFF